MAGGGRITAEHRFKIGEKVVFRILDLPADQTCIEAGAYARVATHEPCTGSGIPVYWLRLGGTTCYAVRAPETHLRREDEEQGR